MKDEPIFVLFGDTHFGSMTALCDKKVHLDAGGTYEASPLQLDLLDFWNDFWSKIEAYRKKNKNRPLWLIHMGDIVDGTIKHTTQSLPSIEDQEQLAFRMLEKKRAIADKFFILRGTDAHVGEQAQSEVRLSKWLKADGCAYHQQIKINGKIRFDLAHHGKSGGLPWTSSAANVAARIQMEYSKHGMPLPRFVVRGHTHVIDDSGERNPSVRAFVTPAWQCRTSYAHKVASYAVSDIGGVIVDGETVNFLRYGFESVGKYEDTLVVNV